MVLGSHLLHPGSIFIIEHSKSTIFPHFHTLPNTAPTDLSTSLFSKSRKSPRPQPSMTLLPNSLLTAQSGATIQSRHPKRKKATQFSALIRQMKIVSLLFLLPVCHLTAHWQISSRNMQVFMHGKYAGYGGRNLQDAMDTCHIICTGRKILVAMQAAQDRKI